MTANEKVEREITVAFQQVFGEEGKRSKAQRIVIAKLRQLARAGKPLFMPHESDRELAMREGRAEMWLEIERRTNLTPPETLRDLLGHIAETTGED
jgi:hypothetical protein